MRNSYIANSHEAAALNSGKQTAVLVKMKVQPKLSITELVVRHDHILHKTEEGVIPKIDPLPYKLGQEVYVREKWAEYKNLYDCMRGCDRVCICNKEYVYNSENLSAEERSALQSPATMPQSAARTRFKVVEVEAVRVRDMAYRDAIKLPIRHVAKYAQYAINKFGQQAWDNNDYVWFFKIEKC